MNGNADSTGLVRRANGGPHWHRIACGEEREKPLCDPVLPNTQCLSAGQGKANITLIFRDSEMGEIRRIAHNELWPASEVLARSLHDDSISRGLIPDEARRRRLLPKLFSHLVRAGLLFGEVHATSHELEGISVWLSPDAPISTFAKLFRVGVAWFPIEFGLRLSYRFLACHEQLEALREQHAPKRHWYLQLLGVDPPFQRRGHGRSLLEPMLARLDRAQVACCLDTENQDNVGYYEQLGFHVVATSILQAAGTHCWFMSRST